MKKHILLFALIAFVSTAFAQNSIKKSFTGVKRLKVNTSSGDCEIRKNSGNSVEVEVIHSLDKNQFTPRFEQSGDRLDLSEEFTGRNFNGNVTWKISVPDGMNVRFSTGSGNLSASDLTIDLDATTGSGDLDFSTVKGQLAATTGSGGVELSGFSGDVKLNTGSGNMNVMDSEGDLDLNCGSGNIRINNTKAYFRVNTGSGTVNADKITVNGSSKFNTGSGRAKVTLAATPKFDISVNSGSGDAELNFNGNEIVGEVIMKSSKRNGNITAPFQFDKTEEVNQGYNNGDVTVVKTAQKGKGTNRITVSTGSGDAVLRQ